MAISLPFAIDDLGDDDLLQLVAAPQPQPTPALAPDAAASGATSANPASAPVDINSLTDADLMALAKPSGAPKTDVGLWESFGRGALTGATFNWEQELGLADQTKQEAAREANPWTYFMGEMAGSLVPMVGTGALGAAAKGTSLAARGARGLASVMAPSRTTTVGGSALQGAKLGAVYGGLSGAGAADVKPEDSYADAAAKRALGAGLGTVVGAPLGLGLGAAGHGASRLVGAAVNRLSPELRDLVAAASAPETQGARDLARHARYDDYTLEDFARLRQAINDPAQAHRYADLNLMEALEVGRMRPMPHTGELKPEIKVSPNLSDVAQDAANTQGVGRQLARQNWATRNQEMGAKVAADVDELFGDRLGPTLANQFGRTIPGKADDAALLPKLIDDAFGSGELDSNIAALAARAANFNKRYDRLRKGPLQLAGPELTRVAQTVPEVQQALNYAAKRDMIRAAEMGGDWKESWSSRKLGEGIQTLSPQNILDMHHFFVMAAKPRVGGDPAEQAMMQGWKGWFSKFVDERLKGHENLRAQYTAFKAAMEAQEIAEALPVVGGGLKPKALEFFADAEKKLAAAQKAADRYLIAWEKSNQRIERGEIKTPNSKAYANYNAARELGDGWQEVLNNFRSTWGEKIKQTIAGLDNPERVVKQMLTGAGRERILRVLGPEQGEKFLNDILVVEARSQGLSLGLKAGGADHQALQFFDKAVAEGRADVVQAFQRAWGERIKQELATAATPAQVAQHVRSLLTKEGKDRILRILGPDDGRTFIEMLYNKEQQLGLGARLYGGPDTAYKLARQKKTESLSNALSALKPWAPQPMEFVKSVGQMVSSRYTQNRADQINRLLARQGRDAVTEAIDAILANQQLTLTGQPYVLRPALRTAGPLAAASAPDYEERRPVLPPYRP